jgi:hypothetical protein
MDLPELIQHQIKWEKDRGIHNGNWGGDRIQVELDEAKEEPDLYKKLVEYADVTIITMGSVGALVKALDLTAEDFQQILVKKLAINDAKYPLSNFESRSTEEAIEYSKNKWDGMRRFYSDE